MNQQHEHKPKAALLHALNRIRRLLRDEDGKPTDLLKNAKHPFSSLGIKLVPSFELDAQPVANVISECIHGGPAHINGQIMVGDVVLAVNGTPLDYGNAGTLLGSSNMLGAPCNLTLRRDDEILDVQLTWTSAVFARDMNMLFRFFEVLETEIRKQSSPSTALSCLKELIMHTIEMEQNRSLEEEQLAAKLLKLQLTVIDEVDNVETSLHHSMSNDLVPRQELIAAMFEAKHLHEQLVHSRDREAEADRRVQELRARVQDLEANTRTLHQSDLGSDLSVELNSARHKIEELERQLAERRDSVNESMEIRAMQDKINNLESSYAASEMRAMKTKIVELEVKVSNARQTEADLRWQIQFASENERKLQREWSQAKQSLDSSMLLLEASKEDLQKQVGLRKSAEAELADLRAKNATYPEGSRSDIHEQAILRERELTAAKLEISRLEARLSSLASLQQELSACKSELTQSHQLVNIKSAEIARLQSQLTTASSQEQETESNRSEISRLIQLVATKDSEVAKLQSQLGAAKNLEHELAPMRMEAARHNEIIQRKDAEISALQAQLRKEKENWSPLVVRTGIAELELLNLRARNAELERFREQVQDQRIILDPKRGSAGFQPLTDDKAMHIEYLERELEKQRQATAAAERDVVAHISIEQELRDRLQASAQEVARLSYLLGGGTGGGGGGGGGGLSGVDHGGEARQPPSGGYRNDGHDGRDRALQVHVGALREKIASLEGQARAQMDRR